jgi:hypothetical protein
MNVTTLSNNHRVKVLWSHAYYAQYNALFDVFYTFCKVEERYISLHTEMNIQSFYTTRENENNNSKIYKCEYQLTSKGLVQTSKKYIGLGADPRIVSDGKNCYAYVIGYGKAEHPALLYCEKDDSLHRIEAPQGFDWGKNWQPFIKDEKLFIVHELMPYSIYEVDLDTYRLKQILFIDTDLGLPAHFTNHTMFRGGANAIAKGEYLYGLGRASAQPYKHIPFFWSSHKNQAPLIQFTDLFNALSQKGFSIIDPTSFFEDEDGRVYIGLACSQTCWFHEQKFLNLLVVIDPSHTFDTLPYLDELLTDYNDFFINREPNLKKHIFFCDRLQQDIPFKHEYGIVSTGQEGMLVYGPYLDIKESAYLVVELSYLTVEEEGEEAGRFDICLSKTEDNGEVSFIEVDKCTLVTTGKETQKALLYFDTSHFLGYKVEFRVYVKEGIHLNAFHIKTDEVSYPISCAKLPATIQVDNSNGIRSVKGQKGFLFFGPYQLIEQDESYKIILHYKSEANKFDRVGYFDIALSRDHDDIKSLSKTEVYGTENQWSSLVIDCLLEDYVGYKFEIRFEKKDEKEISVSYISLLGQQKLNALAKNICDNLYEKTR